MLSGAAGPRPMVWAASPGKPHPEPLPAARYCASYFQYISESSPFNHPPEMECTVFTFQDRELKVRKMKSPAKLVQEQSWALTFELGLSLELILGLLV